MQNARSTAQQDLFARSRPKSKAVPLGIPIDGAPIIVCYGGGVDSTAMLVMLKRHGIRPDLIMFADTGGEFPEVYDYVRRIDFEFRGRL